LIAEALGARVAEAAVSAPTRAPYGDGIPFADPGCIRPDGGDLTRILMAEDEGKPDRGQQRNLPVSDVNIRMANPRGANAHQDFAASRLWDGDVLDSQFLTRFVKSYSPHSRIPHA
jgi:hypothetical protein